ncbi:MAG: aminotransferase class V-fold PLP-dependent enzyme [Candidatus Hydrogenedentes bacterium]|nr:aminotransferase class V-fold PLP-dependent enzyme [Candidatus Hydrogenedentota bacterium]
MKTIYLDHSATTPVREEVLEAMLPHLRESYGNAGSIHAVGRAARRAVDDAREQVAALIHADVREIVFTSGGTESDNWAIRGLVTAHPKRPANIVVSAVEHHAVLHAAGYVSKHEKVEVRVAGVDENGVIDIARLESLIDSHTLLVSVMHANNETGAIQPVEKIAVLCTERGVTFHTDAVQSVGKIEVDVRSIHAHALAISGHKLYAPKGVGACFVRKGLELEPLLLGGAQERERRAGTENVAGIVGLGKACELAQAEMESTATRIARLRDAAQQRILAAIPNCRVNGPRDNRLPGLLNIGFAEVEGESVVLGLDVEGIAVSSGATCASGAIDPSHVLLAMGQSHDEAQSAVRFSFGRDNTEADVDRLMDVLPPLIERLRGV